MRMNNRMRTTMFMLFTGVLALGVGIFFMISGSRQAARDTESATATVVRYEEGEQFNSTTNTMDPVYYPVVTYEVNGQTIESKYSQYDYGDTYQIGETVEIKYDPNNPEEFMMADESKRSLTVYGEIGFGIVMIVLSIVRIVLGK